MAWMNSWAGQAKCRTWPGPKMPMAPALKTTKKNVTTPRALPMRRGKERIGVRNGSTMALTPKI